MSARTGTWQIATGGVLLGLVVVACVSADWISGSDPMATNAGAISLPPLSPGYPMGSDLLGRDLLAGLLHGGRVSLAVGFGATVIALVIGIGVGAAAALGPRWLDTLLMRFIDVIITLPFILMIISLRFFFDPSLWVIIIPLGAMGWMWAARVARARIASIAEENYILAARGCGSTPWQTLTQHILPNALAPVLASASLILSTSIVTEATLSFFGLGVPVNTPSWGTALVSAQREMLIGRWWVMAWPTLAIALTVLATNLLANGFSCR